MMCKDAVAFEPLVIPFPRDPDDIVPDLYDDEEEEEEGDNDE